MTNKLFSRRLYNVTRFCQRYKLFVVSPKSCQFSWCVHIHDAIPRWIATFEYIAFFQMSDIMCNNTKSTMTSQSRYDDDSSFYVSYSNSRKVNQQGREKKNSWRQQKLHHSSTGFHLGSSQLDCQRIQNFHLNWATEHDCNVAHFWNNVAIFHLRRKWISNYDSRLFEFRRMWTSPTVVMTTAALSVS